VSVLATLERALREETWIAQATVISAAGLGRKLLVLRDGSTEGSLGNAELDHRVVALALEPERQTGPAAVGAEGPGESTAESTAESPAESPAEGAGEAPDATEVFLEIFAPLPKLVVVGAVHVAVHLVHFAKRLGFRTIVVDARTAFATAERFPHADELIVGWPGDVLAAMKLHDSAYCVFLTHDPKLDDPALVAALRSDARYVGALGSTRTQAKRVERLKEAGLSDQQVARIHAPIGLDLGGRRPEEIALSIAAQMVQARYGKA
jgi:xanthine dehydrogenase accessory factor